jgi:hypothetical protein
MKKIKYGSNKIFYNILDRDKIKDKRNTYL